MAFAVWISIAGCAAQALRAPVLDPTSSAGAPTDSGALATAGGIDTPPTSGPEDTVTAGSAGGSVVPAGLCRIALSCQGEIVDDPKTACSLQITDGAGAVVFAGQAGVELRGRSSRHYPKKNYGVELRTVDGADNPVPMMGMGRESDWIFDGSWVDRSLMRNDLVFGLFRDMGHYAPESRSCTLSLNGQNQGFYRLSEKIKRDDDRVAIPRDDGTGTSFIVAQDRDGQLTFPVSSDSSSGVWQLVYPNQDQATAAQAAAVQAWLDGLHAALNGADPGNPTTGVFAYLSFEDTVDFVLIQEFSKNVDAFNFSLNLFRGPGETAKFIPWDFDLAFGQPTIRVTPGNEAPEGWVPNRTPFITGLTRVPDLLERLGPRWRELRAGPFADAAILARLDLLQAVLDVNSTAENFARWPIGPASFTRMYRPYSLYSVSSYAEEVERLRTWIRARLAFIDAQIDSYPN